MTCVVAVAADSGIVWMGADAAGVSVSCLSLQARKDPKIYRVGPMLIGFTTSFRMGQLLGHALRLPDEPKRPKDIRRWMNIEFIDAVRQCLKDGGFAEKKDEVERGGDFLVAYRGRIFGVYGDFQVGEPAQPYGSMGCGSDLALGSLHTTARTMKESTPITRIRLALAAAERFSAGVRGPFLIRRTPT